jgi:hypothetical protein
LNGTSTVRRVEEVAVVAPAKAGRLTARLERPQASARNFRYLFCGHFRCTPEQYEKQLFIRCLHRHARPFARLLTRLNPAFFSEDRGFICDLATARSREEVLTELNRFYGRNVRDRNWLRKAFSLRVSGKRVQRLSRKLFV